MAYTAEEKETLDKVLKLVDKNAVYDPGDVEIILKQDDYLRQVIAENKQFYKRQHKVMLYTYILVCTLVTGLHFAGYLPFSESLGANIFFVIASSFGLSAFIIPFVVGYFEQMRENTEAFLNLKKYTEIIVATANWIKRKDVSFWRSLSDKTLYQEIAQTYHFKGYNTSVFYPPRFDGVGIALEREKIYTPIIILNKITNTNINTIKRISRSVSLYPINGIIIITRGEFSENSKNFAKSKNILLLQFEDICEMYE